MSGLKAVFIGGVPRTPKDLTHEAQRGMVATRKEQG
jgi:hypothetical protein